MKKLTIFFTLIISCTVLCKSQEKAANPAALEIEYKSIDDLMQQKYHAQIQNFVTKSNTEMFWGNGAFLPIKTPKNDKDALIKSGIEVMDIDTKESKGTAGALILFAEDVVIHQKKYRAVLFENNNSTSEIAVYQKINQDQFFFRTYPVDILSDSIAQKLSYITKNNFDIIKAYVKQRGMASGENFDIYLFGADDFGIEYSAKKDNEYIEIDASEFSKYKYRLKIDKNNNVIWDYLCIPVPWTRDAKERELNGIIQMIIARFENQIYNESK